ncbi:MAG TPA: bifunctional diaminohydroxyphosphoribosylaminopyrimidine deaminase/5-amino-6-(5-phosphoribosylamino)uracil reductase RibD [candidate division Zixibacteria bacterium]|nr:bifunctional diaminohydroxyphosphoribosylaminopyrimidine deaminase/5-amino-6-(5-phosphoribosylamino)uracil reductase RibD [candidate division Zixibacteria bacterium]
MPADRNADERFMRLALELAAKGGACTRPNPMVGAVVVSGGEVVGRGYHQRAGAPHAEAEAIREAGERSRGGTIYVTLEPCCHTDKRTPPCVETIIKSGIARVVYGADDPNPKVCGRGCRMLRQAGIEVESRVLLKETETLNEVYRKYMTTGRPFVTLKLAMSLDGRIATKSGESRGLSCPESLERVHRMRLESEAVLVGADTVAADDPELTVRLVENPEKRQPTRFVVDSTLRTALDRKIWDQSAAKTVLATTSRADEGKLKELDKREIEVWTIDADTEGRVDLEKLVRKMGLHEYYTLLVEGGGRVAASMLGAGLVDKISFFYAPRLIGGDGVPSCAGMKTDTLGKALSVKEITYNNIGADLLVEARIGH